MAKLTGPLMSLDARGSIAQTITFSGWKGLKIARQRVIPANPNTADQQAQRGKMTTLVGYWHSDGYTAADKSAYDLWASTFSTPQSGFNAFIANGMSVLLEGDTWAALTDGTVSNEDASSFDFALDCGADKTYKLYYGCTPTTMLNEVAGVFDTDHVDFDVSGLSASTKYYFYVIGTVADYDHQRTGIYTAETAAS